MATLKHRTAFALALRTISPSLAALHASRVRLEHAGEAITPLTCVRCGHAPVRVRKRGDGVARTCGTCGLVEAVPVPRGGAAALFESTRKRRKTRAPTPGPTPEPKRVKKKSGLQELLARNRERQKQDTTGGLSFFLEGL